MALPHGILNQILRSSSSTLFNVAKDAKRQTLQRGTPRAS